VTEEGQKAMQINLQEIINALADRAA